MNKKEKDWSESHVKRLQEQFKEDREKGLICNEKDIPTFDEIMERIKSRKPTNNENKNKTNSRRCKKEK